MLLHEWNLIASFRIQHLLYLPWHKDQNANQNEHMHECAKQVEHAHEVLICARLEVANIVQLVELRVVRMLQLRVL